MTALTPDHLKHGASRRVASAVAPFRRDVLSPAHRWRGAILVAAPALATRHERKETRRLRRRLLCHASARADTQHPTFSPKRSRQLSGPVLLSSRRQNSPLGGSRT